MPISFYAKLIVHCFHSHPIPLLLKKPSLFSLLYIVFTIAYFEDFYLLNLNDNKLAVKQLARGGTNPSTTKRKSYTTQQNTHTVSYRHHTTVANTCVVENYPFNYHTISGGSIHTHNYLVVMLYHRGTTARSGQTFTM